MFITTGAVLIFIIAKFLFGCVIGVVVAALIHRARLSTGTAMRAALFAGMAILIASGITGWARYRVSFQNGHRLDTAPWGEEVRPRNFIAEHELALCLASSAIAAILASVRSREKNRRSSAFIGGQ